METAVNKEEEEEKRVKNYDSDTTIEPEDSNIDEENKRNEEEKEEEVEKEVKTKRKYTRSKIQNKRQKIQPPITKKSDKDKPHSLIVYANKNTSKIRYFIIFYYSF